MSWHLIVGFCGGCGGLMSFNPSRTYSAGNGKPLCRKCLEFINAEKRKRGMEEWPELPGAYEEFEVREA